MPDEKFEHPLETQNAIERKIQLEGSKDPENFKMPDGRTLSEVRKTLQDQHQKEFVTEAKTIGRTTREMSPVLNKGKDLVMTGPGNIIDVTEPPKSEKKERRSLAEMRTAADVNVPEDFEEPKAPGSGGVNPVPTTSATPPPSSSTPSGAPATGTVTPGSTPSTGSGTTK